jgi:uncharacterized protein with NAD-binding domain and iron-sulfur cluster
MPEAKEKVVILGGGVGAVAAAFALTEGANADKYDVTIYQVGWRLGGKGANSRATPACRIEEHGMHIWFGFYANALAMMKRCYDELGDPKDTFANAFIDQSFVVLEDHYEGRWIHFPIPFPPGNLGHPQAARDYAKAILRWIAEDWSASSAGGVPSPLEKAIELLEELSQGAHDSKVQDVLVTALCGALTLAQSALRPTTSGAGLSDKLRWAWMTYDLGLAVTIGMAAEGVFWKGFSAIDHLDLWEFLEKHGASSTHKHCVMVRGLYSQAFAFPEGDEARRSMSAGASIRAGLRMLLGYEGAFMRKMRAGMGDIVFAPFYRVLKQRGVQFKFFHRVRALHLSTDGSTTIGRITLGRQVSLKGNAPPHRPPSCCPDEPEYDPLITVPDTFIKSARHCWPNEPDETQIVDGDVAKIAAMKANGTQYFNLESVWTSWDAAYEKDCSLERGTHFDHVVLAISVGALERICAPLAQRSSRWAKMLKTTKTVRTQAAQLWLSEDLAGLGWTMPEPVHGAYAFPMDSWASMTQTRPAEPWPNGYDPKQTAYFCGVLPHGTTEDPEWFSDPGFPKRQRTEVETWMKKHLQQNIAHIWPKAVGQAGFRWELLVDVNDGAGEARFNSQFLVADVDPTERYVLSVPDSMAHRLPSDDSDFDNLTLAGDWTKNAVNLGCVEAAVSSALAASRKISGHPHTIAGEKDL